MDPETNITILKSNILELPPSCIEFAPKVVDEGVEYLVVGTYHLHNEKTENLAHSLGPNQQSREGSLILFKISNKELTLIRTIPYPSAILDLHFYNGHNTLAVASSTGTISIFHLVKRAEILDLQLVATHQVAHKDILVLSLAWYPYTNALQTGFPRLLFYSLSNGHVLAAGLSGDFKSFSILNNGTPLIIHDDNAWTCTAASKILLSGGDDSMLRMARFDLHTPHDAENEFEFETILIDGSKIDPKDRSVTQSYLEGHNAGVTAIIFLPSPSTFNDDSFILTGSYDDHVRIFKSTAGLWPKMSGVRKLTELLVGGGVWRLKLMEAYPLSSETDDQAWEYIVLASCMFAGAQILKIKGSYHGSWSIQVGAEMKIHQSMCYSCDAQPQRFSSEEEQRDLSSEGPAKTWTVASSSFYDKLLVLWEWQDGSMAHWGNEGTEESKF
ncbi:hypothetical protein EV44_g1906 [Erysiphe necator]|uniref:methylated diphthine methylhydrolase n=1 Tax=Uncinula necator TaxID=52586 RepID=A0A0B1P5Z9_UNCNE|nr:hypothetical protein EV44_g1906 [Erysiphe necator]